MRGCGSDGGRYRRGMLHTGVDKRTLVEIDNNYYLSPVLVIHPT